MNKKLLLKISDKLVEIHTIVNTKRIKSNNNYEIVDSCRDKNSLTDAEQFSFQISNYKLDLEKLFFILSFKCNGFLIEENEKIEIYYDLMRSSSIEFKKTIDYYFNPVSGVIVDRLIKYKRNKKIIKWTNFEKKILNNEIAKICTK